MKISVIIPTLNEESTIEKTLDAISRLVNVAEIVVVDGGSSDRTNDIVRTYNSAKRLNLINAGVANRGAQMHAGTEQAAGDVFWFVHADTRPVQGCGKQIIELMRYDEVAGGNFGIVFGGTGRWSRFLTWLYPQLRAIGLVYGDSAMFVRRTVYQEVGGFRDFALFEDVDLFKRIVKKGRFVHCRLTVTTSSRRFENRSFLATFAKWSIFQGLYWIGVPPRFLATRYKALR